jgi:hypothetical protein
MSEPPPETVEAALNTIADELRRLQPGLEVLVHRPSQALPTGAVRLCAAVATMSRASSQAQFDLRASLED